MTNLGAPGFSQRYFVEQIANQGETPQPHPTPNMLKITYISVIKLFGFLKINLKWALDDGKAE